MLPEPSVGNQHQLALWQPRSQNDALFDKRDETFWGRFAAAKQDEVIRFHRIVSQQIQF